LPLKPRWKLNGTHRSRRHCIRRVQGLRGRPTGPRGGATDQGCAHPDEKRKTEQL
jgi:hypothetical protein